MLSISYGTILNTEELMNATLYVTLIGNSNEVFAFQVSVPSQNESVLPKGTRLTCNNSNREVILYQSLTSLNTTLTKVNMNKGVNCCVSLQTTMIRCIFYGTPLPFGE